MHTNLRGVCRGAITKERQVILISICFLDIITIKKKEEELHDIFKNI